MSSLWFQWNWRWNSLSLPMPKYFTIRNEFFAQIQSYLHNFQKLSYPNLMIKLMNSKDSNLNLRLTNYISLLNNLRDNVSGKNNVTWLSDISIISSSSSSSSIISFSFRSYFTNLLQYCKLNYNHANKGYCCCCAILRHYAVMWLKCVYSQWLETVKRTIFIIQLASKY